MQVRYIAAKLLDEGVIGGEVGLALEKSSFRALQASECQDFCASLAWPWK